MDGEEDDELDFKPKKKKKDKKSKKSKNKGIGKVEPDEGNNKIKLSSDGYMYRADDKIGADSDDDSDIEQSVDEILEEKIVKNKKSKNKKWKMKKST